MKSDEIHKLLKSLETKRIDDSTTVSMLHSLRKNAMATKPGVQRLVKQGCVPCLLKLLYRHVACEREGTEGMAQISEDGISTALSIISNLLMEREARQQVKRDGIETLGTVLAEYKVEEIQVRCCRALGNLAMDSHARSTMAQVQLAPTLVKLLEVRYIDAEEEEEMEEVSKKSASKSEPKKGQKMKTPGRNKKEEEQEKKREQSASTSESKTGQTTKTHDKEAKDSGESAQDAFETVFPSWPVVQYTCRALRYLVDDLKVRRQLLESSMVWAHAVLLKSEDSNIVACVIRVLSELWTKMNKKITERMSSEVVRAGVIRKIMDMVNSDDDQLSQHAFTVLIPLTQHPHSAALIGASDGVPFFLDLLVSPKWQSSQKEVISGLCLLARESVNRVKIRENGGLKVFLETLRDDKLSGVHDRVVSSLLSFLHDDESLKKLLEEGLVDVLLNHLQRCGGYSSQMPINFCEDAEELLESCEVDQFSPNTTEPESHGVNTLSPRVPSTRMSGSHSGATCVKTENQSPETVDTHVSCATVKSEELQAALIVSEKSQTNPAESAALKIKISMDGLTCVALESKMDVINWGGASPAEDAHNESSELKEESENIDCGPKEVETSVSARQEEMTVDIDDNDDGNNNDCDAGASPFTDRNCADTHTYSMHSPSYQAETTWHMQNYHPGITRKSFHPSDPYLSPSPGSSGSDDSRSVGSSPYSPISAGSYNSPSYSNRFSPAYSSAASSPAYSDTTLSPRRSICESQYASPVYSGPLSPGGSSDILSPLSPGIQLGSPASSPKGSPVHHTPGSVPLLFSSSEEDSCDVDDSVYFKSETNTSALLETNETVSAKPKEKDAVYFISKSNSNTPDLTETSETVFAKPREEDAVLSSFPKMEATCEEEYKAEMLSQPLEQCSLGFSTSQILDTACGTVQGDNSVVADVLVLSPPHDSMEGKSDTEVSPFSPTVPSTQMSRGHRGSKWANNSSSYSSDKGPDKTHFSQKNSAKLQQSRNQSGNKHSNMLDCPSAENQETNSRTEQTSSSEDWASADFRQEPQPCHVRLGQTPVVKKPEVQGENVEMRTDTEQNMGSSTKPEQTMPDGNNSSTFGADRRDTSEKLGLQTADNTGTKSDTDITARADDKHSTTNRVKRFLSSNSSDSEGGGQEKDAVHAAKRRRKLKQPGEYAAITQDNILKLLSCLSDRNDVEKQLASSKVVYCLLDHLALAQKPQERCVRILSRIVSRPLCLEPLLAMCAPAVIVRTLMLDSASGIKPQATESLLGDVKMQPSPKSERGSPSAIARRISLGEKTSEKMSGVRRRFSACELTPASASKTVESKQKGATPNRQQNTSEEGRQKAATLGQEHSNTAVDLCQAGSRLLGHISNQALCPYGEGVVSYALNRHSASRQLTLATSLLFLMPYWDREKQRKILFSKGILDKLMSALCTPHTTSRAIKEAIFTGIVFFLHHLQPGFRFEPEESDSLLHKAVANLAAGSSADRLTTLVEPAHQAGSHKAVSRSNQVDETPHSSHSESSDQISICAYSMAKKDLHLHVAETKTQLGANRDILMKKSAMFAAMLQGSYIESTQSEITITDSTPSSLEFILHFLHGCDEHCSILVPEDEKESPYMTDLHRDFESTKDNNLKDVDTRSQEEAVQVEVDTDGKAQKTHSSRGGERFLISSSSSADQDKKLHDCFNMIALADRFLLPELAHYLCSVLSCCLLDKASAAGIFQFAAFHGLRELAEDSMLMLLLSPGPIVETASQVIELAQSEMRSEVKTTITALIRRGVTMTGK